MLSFLGYATLKLKEFTGLSSFQFLAELRRAIFYGFLSIYLSSLGLSTFEVTLMATVGMVANTSTQAFLWGPLLDRLRASNMFVVVGEFVAGIGHIVLYGFYVRLLGLSQQQQAGYAIIFGLGVIEIFWSMSNVGWSTLISELTMDDERQQIIGQLSIIGGIGGIFGATAGGLLFQQGLGFENGILFYIPAVVMILSSGIVFMLLRQAKTIREVEIAHQEQSTGQIETASLDPPIRSLYLLFILALVFINFGRNSIAIISSLYLYEPLGLAASDLQIALYRNVTSIAAILAGIAVGTIIAKTSDSRVMNFGTLFAFLSIIWLALAPTFNSALLSAFLYGSSFIIIQSSSYSIAAKIIPPSHRGRLFAWYNATFFLSWGIGGTFILAPIVDFLITRGMGVAEAYRVSFYLASVLVVIGFVILQRSLRDIARFQNTSQTSSCPNN